MHQYSNALSERKAAGGVFLVGIGLIGCSACSALKQMLENVIATRVPPVPIDLLWFDIASREELSTIGLQVRLFPTLIAFKDTQPKLGWEGFAVLAPSEISAELVTEALNQVDAL